jgi:hypothetical protein
MLEEDGLLVGQFHVGVGVPAAIQDGFVQGFDERGSGRRAFQQYPVAWDDAGGMVDQNASEFLYSVIQGVLLSWVDVVLEVYYIIADCVLRVAYSWDKIPTAMQAKGTYRMVESTTRLEGMARLCHETTIAEHA